MHKRKKILTHVGLWTVWMFLVCSWAIFSGTPQPIIPVAYNIVAAIAVFYAARWVAAKYWAEVEVNTSMWVNDKGLVTRRPGAGYYIFRRPVAGMLMLVFGYIALSLFVDGLFQKYGMTDELYQNFYLYTYVRWAAESVYICGGNIYAAIEYHFRQERLRMQTLEEGYQYERQVNQTYAADFKKLMMYYQEQADRLRNRLNNTDDEADEWEGDDNNGLDN
jgi:hypothetical protein